MYNDFLPEGDENLNVRKPYVNISKLSEGEHRYRIVGKPIAGFIDWENNKPKRYRPDKKPSRSFDPDRPIKSFWAMHVWDYQQEGLFIMEITQAGILNSLREYARNEDWGDLTKYDIKIKKEGAGKETKYSVIPIPPKPMSKEIQNAVDLTEVRLSALYEGKDPWRDLDESQDTFLDSDQGLNASQIGILQSLIEEWNDPVGLKKLEEALNVISIYNIDPDKDFHRVITTIRKRIANKEDLSA